MFRKLSSSVGSGKTEAVICHIQQNPRAGYIYVAPTLALCTEIYKRVLVALVNDPAYSNDDELIQMIASDDGVALGVYQRAQQACTNFDPANKPIIIVTTKTFEYLMANLADAFKSQFDVFIDEGLPAIKQQKFSPSEPQSFLSHFEQDTDGFVCAAPGAREILEWVAFSPSRLSERSLDHLNVEQFRTICELVVSGNYDVYISRTEKSIEALGLLSPEPLKAFRSVTLIVAIFERTLLPLLWQQRHGIEFEEFQLDEPLFDAHAERGHLMSIWYALHEDDGPSKKNLSRNYATKDEYESNPEMQVVYKIAEEVEQYFQGREYCWAANNNFKLLDKVLTGRHMPTNSSGLDEYRRCDGVVSLACVNPQPWVKNHLLEVLDLEDEELYDLWRFSHTYQTVGRCSLRDRTSEREIEVVVVSKRCADQLADLFAGAKIKGQLTKLPRMSGQGRRDEKSEELGISYTAADHSAYSKYKKRRMQSGEEPLKKHEWFEKVRKPNLEG